MEASWWVALAAGILGCIVFTLPHLRDRARAKQERQANCRHDWTHFNAMQDPSFPVRQCRWCGKQEMLTRCLECGRVLRRKQ